jgi:hypothetical protein
MSKIKKEMLKTEIQHLKADAVFYWGEGDRWRSPFDDDDGEYEFEDFETFLYLGHFRTPDGIWYMARPLGAGCEPELLVWFDSDSLVYIVPWEPGSSKKNGAEYPSRCVGI